MAIEFYWWDEAQTTFYYKVSGKWTCQEIEQATEKGNQIVEAVRHPVNLMINMSDITGYPDGFMAYIKPQMLTQPSNVNNIYVLLPDNSLTRMFLSVYKRMYGSFSHNVVILLNETPEHLYERLEVVTP